MAEGSRRAIFAALLANLGVAGAKFVGFLFTNSASLLAEAIHSVADTADQGFLLLGRAQAGRAADRVHPFGYGRVRYFWAFVVALVLFSAGGLFAVVDGVEKLLHPHTLDSPGWAFGILVVAVVMEGASLRTAARQARAERQPGEGWWEFVRTAKGPELPVILLEDSGAVVGLAFAIIGVALSLVTGNERFDAAGSLAIGVLLVSIATVLAIEMRSLLIGEGADATTAAAIRDAISGSAPVHRLIHLRTEHLGPDDILVAAKVAFDPGLSVPELAGAIDATEARIRAAVSQRCLVYLEPDLDRAEGEPDGQTGPG